MSGLVGTPLTQSPTPVGTESLADYARRWWRGVRAGELGSLPIIGGLLLIVVFFQSQSDKFLSAQNFVNLQLQMAGVTTIAIGVVFVLLLGEIDLSVGYVSGVAGVSAALLITQRDFPGPFGLLAAVVLGAGIGLLHGLIITRIGVPSFVVTLAGLLAWNGVVLILMGSRGTISVTDSFIRGLTTDFLSAPAAWGLLALTVLAYAAVQLSRDRARRRTGLQGLPLALIGVRVLGLAAAGALVVVVSMQDRGVPYVAVLVVALLVAFTFVATRTRFGRHVYAVGGNAEAARRAGIGVNRIRVLVFMISSAMAALGGVILLARLGSVSPAAGSGEILLNSIASAVIGGTSLFGGRGHVRSALLGALVISATASGMSLMSLSSGIKFLVTGLILLAAVTVDSLARRRLAAAGR